MSISAPISPPPLRDGDRLTADEFLRRWEAMPDLEHVELLNGIVYMPSPIGPGHTDFHKLLSSWLDSYEDGTPGCSWGQPATWRMGENEVPEPDLTLRILPECGGQTRRERYYAGAPELVIEVAVSTEDRDLGEKFLTYQRAGVHEYIVALASRQLFVWYERSARGLVGQALCASPLTEIVPDADAIFRSRCFPGLWLDPAALWRGDKAGVRAILQLGLASPEHAAFVASLAAYRAK